MVDQVLEKCLKGDFDEIKKAGAVRVGLEIKHSCGAYSGKVKHVLSGPDGHAAIVAWENGKVSVDGFDKTHVIAEDGRLQPPPPKKKKEPQTKVKS